MGKPSIEGDSQPHTSGSVVNAPPASPDPYLTGFSGSSRGNGKGESRGRRGRGSKGSGARGLGGRSRATDAAETKTEAEESCERGRGDDAPANATQVGQGRKGLKGGRGGTLPADQHAKGGRGRSHVTGGESSSPAKGRGKDGNRAPPRDSAGPRGRVADHRHRRDGGDSARWRRADVIPATSEPPDPTEAASNDAHCIVCCNPLKIVAFMSCGHSQVCAECCLRSRMLFKDRKCPLCKADRPEVLLAAVDSAGRPAGYAGDMAALQERALYLELMKLPERSEHNGGFWAKQWEKSWEAYLLVAPDEAALERSNPMERLDAAAAAASGAALRQLTSVTCGLCAEQGLPCSLSTVHPSGVLCWTKVSSGWIGMVPASCYRGKET